MDPLTLVIRESLFQSETPPFPSPATAWNLTLILLSVQPASRTLKPCAFYLQNNPLLHVLCYCPGSSLCDLFSGLVQPLQAPVIILIISLLCLISEAKSCNSYRSIKNPSPSGSQVHRAHHLLFPFLCARQAWSPTLSKPCPCFASSVIFVLLIPLPFGSGEIFLL